MRIWFYNKIQCREKVSFLFVSDHQTHLSLFFFQRGTCWCVLGDYPTGKPGVYVTNYMFFVKRAFRSSGSPKKILPPEGLRAIRMLFGKKKQAFHRNLHRLFLPNIKICQMIWNNSVWVISRKQKKSGMGKVFAHSTVNRERKTDAD